MYQPKLNLIFNPPLERNAEGINYLNKVLETIEILYPEVKWWNGLNPSKLNPFNTPHRDGWEIENGASEFPDTIYEITIGYTENLPNRITYGEYGDYGDFEWSAQDGYEWLAKTTMSNKFGSTSDIFDFLNEAKKKYQPKLNLRFDPPIEDADYLDEALRVINSHFPNVQWRSSGNIINYNPIRVESTEDVAYLTIGFFKSSPDILTYTDGDLDYVDSEHDDMGYESDDGYNWVETHKIDYNKTYDIFKSLNEMDLKNIIRSVLIGQKI